MATHKQAKTGGKVGSLIGAGVRIVGEVSGQDDIHIDGSVEGSVSLPEHNLHVGPAAKLKAEVRAQSVNVHGQVTGDLKVTGRVVLAQGSRVTGNVYTPRMVLDDGAKLCGRVDMELEKVAASRGKPEASPAK